MLLETIFSNLPDAVVVIARDGKQLMSNPAYEALFSGARDRQDQGGLPLPMHERPEARAVRGDPFTMAFRMTGRDGAVRWFEAKSRPITLNRDEAAIIQFRDISERTLRVLQEEFVARASHELRTPLTALYAYLQLLSRRQDIRENPQVANYLDNALAESKRLTGLIAELSEATRLQLGPLELARQQVDLAELVERVVDISQPLTERQVIRFRRGEPLVISGDPDRLEQVILNLISNAITHASQSRYIDIDVRPADGSAILRVTDQGPGVPAADLPHLFSRFYQVSREDGGSERGLGLGLYISQEIARAHGGEIRVVSQPEQGTTFTVTLPLDRPLSRGGPVLPRSG
jgi:two-component system, chemotaxis family, CheB/CheR fusion protein